jgi:hypothetical protein
MQVLRNQVMRKKKVWRYYCEWCKKSGCSAGHMKNHEKHCTNNPNRDCKMCSVSGGYQEDIKTLIRVLKYEGLNALRDKCFTCPACMLAAIRQSGLNDAKPTEDLIENHKIKEVREAVQGFDYNKEKAEYWAEHNANEIERHRQEGYYY